MSAAYKEEAGVASDPFGQSRTVFEELLARTSTSRALAASHAEVEEDIGRSGRALLRQLFQDHLDLRHSQERRVVVRDERGVQLPERSQALQGLRALRWRSRRLRPSPIETSPSLKIGAGSSAPSPSSRERLRAPRS